MLNMTKNTAYSAHNCTYRTSDMHPGDISVAIVHPGNRVEKMAVPLETTDMEVSVAPEEPHSHDIVIQDMVNYKMGPELAKSKVNGSAFVYRMRGDIFHELPNYDKPFVAKWGAKNIIMPAVDGVLAVTPYFAEKYQSETGVEPVGTAGLWKRPEDYDATTHVQNTVRCLTLTNANYAEKVEPIIEWAPVVNAYHDNNGGEWIIGAKGRYTNRLSNSLARYEHVSFEGYIDKENYLKWANVLLHPSRLDGQPNAILEGMVSQLPVLTTDWITFKEFRGPNIITDAQGLIDQLKVLEDPATRQRHGDKGREYIKTHHTPTKIGQQYQNFFERLL